MNRAERAVSLLDRETRDWILRNISIVEENTFTSWVAITDSGYVMHLGTHMDNYSDRQVKIIMLHEIAHILRGDCLVRIPKEDKQICNTAHDCIINAGFPDFPEQFPGRPYYWDYAAMYDELPSTHIPGWKVIYEVLKKHSPPMESFDGLPQNETKDREKAEQAHAKAVLEAREIPSLKDLGASSLVRTCAKGKVAVQPIPAWARLMERIARKVKRNGFGSLVHVRTWNRPGRVDGLRGVARQPRLTIFLVLDISGSCQALEPVFRGLAATLKRSYNVRLGVFANSFATISHPGEVPSVGGGTEIRPVMAALNRLKPDLAIILTDGEFFDELTLPTCPVWFVLYGNEPPWKRKLRSKDKIIDGKEVKR